MVLVGSSMSHILGDCRFQSSVSNCLGLSIIKTDNCMCWFERPKIRGRPWLSIDKHFDDGIVPCSCLHSSVLVVNVVDVVVVVGMPTVMNNQSN